MVGQYLLMGMCTVMGSCCWKCLQANDQQITCLRMNQASTNLQRMLCQNKQWKNDD
ncbi:hypothetical protein PTKIN_Ptkin16aG0101900 [Pterospermum kingtungense]